MSNVSCGSKLVACIIVLTTSPARADDAPLSDTGVFRPHVSVVDWPFNGFGQPSMAQTMDTTRLLVEGGNWGIDVGGGALESLTHPVVRWLVEAPLLLLWNGATTSVPLGRTALHEAWHRAVLIHAGLRPETPLDGLRVVGSVENVTDDALAAVHDNRRGDFLRFAMAGVEADTEFARGIQRDIFFDGRKPWRDIAALAITKWNTFQYWSACASSLRQDRASVAEDRDIATRESIGLDCTAWVYDLEQPGPYTTRGTHPSGVGIDRERFADDLSARGQRFLQAGRWLSLLNFATPALFGFGRIPGPAGSLWSAELVHHAAPFGHMVGSDARAIVDGRGYAVSFDVGFNAVTVFPAMSLALVRWPLQVGTREATVDVGLSGWLQPASPALDATTHQPGAAAHVRLEWPVAPRLWLTAIVDGKTAGWQPGIVSLDPAVNARIGFDVSL
jgi:hypothetical protein